MTFALGASAARAGVRLELHDAIDSTNAGALRALAAGERGPLWVVAHEQTSGRGRRGRAWVSPRGNLHATLLLLDPGPPERCPELSFVAALAVQDVVPASAVKWPNDVLRDGRKVAGILIEGAPGAVAIGIGINCAHHPRDSEFPAADLGGALPPEQALVALSDALLARLAQWDRGRGFAVIRADWLACASGLGAPVRVRLPERTLTGRFESLDSNGRLVLRLASGAAETIAAGDVFPLVAQEA